MMVLIFLCRIIGMVTCGMVTTTAGILSAFRVRSWSGPLMLCYLCFFGMHPEATKSRKDIHSGDN